MAIPRNKDELLKAINGNFDKLRRELADIPDNVVREKWLEGHAKGTMMSVSDLVAYLVGWNELVLEWLDRYASGEPIDFPEAGFKWNELGLLAQKFYRDYEAVPYQQLVEQLEAAKHRIVTLIEARSDDELYGGPWYKKWTMGRMIQFNTSSPYDNAHGRLHKWKKNHSRFLPDEEHWAPASALTPPSYLPPFATDHRTALGPFRDEPASVAEFVEACRQNGRHDRLIG